MFQIPILCNGQKEANSGTNVCLSAILLVSHCWLQMDDSALQSIKGAEGAAALVGFLQNNAHIYFEPPEINSDTESDAEL